MARRESQLVPAVARAAFWLWLTVGGGLGCATETAERGEACTRTAQCAAGLACIEGECSDDLQGLDGPGSVPMLMPEPADDGGADASGDAGPDASGDGGSDAAGDAAPVDDDAG